MSKILFGFVFLINSVFLSDVNSAQDEGYSHRFFLKKDEIARVIIEPKELVKRPQAAPLSKKLLLKLSWTLFANDQLFVLVNYEGHPYQFIMKKAYPLDQVSMMLLPDGENRVDTRLIAHIGFHDFEQTRQEAILDVWIEDKQERTEVEFKPQK